jgi:hypothetical protein
VTDRPVKRNRPSGELIDGDLLWLIAYAEGDLGAVGSLQAVVSSLELGTYCAPGPDQIERLLERQKARCPSVARARRLMPRWRLLAPCHRQAAVAYCMSCPGMPPHASLLGEDGIARVALWWASTEPNEDEATREMAPRVRSQDGAALRRLLRALERGGGQVVKDACQRAGRTVEGTQKAWLETGTRQAQDWVAAAVYHQRERDWRPTVRFDARSTRASDYLWPAVREP